MKKKYVFLLLILLLIKPLQSQVQLSVYSEVSIITAGPGTELFEAFGHSAIRIKDPVLQLDLIYNYGMFDFNAPNFYTNFVKGKLLYKLGRYRFDYFLRSYQKDKRWVKQQVLNLTQQERQAFFMYLERNVLPQNASYLYDPYFNNCATKLRDITKSILGEKLEFGKNKLHKNHSYRQLMNEEIPWNTWGNFGINIALGNKLDALADDNASMYLPDFVYSNFKKGRVLIDDKYESLIKKEETLLDFKEINQNILFFNPFLIFSLFSILGLLITYFDFKKKKRTKWIDFVLFFISGIIGVLIVFLWFFTNHSTTPNNFNFLWAFAPNLIIGFLLLKKIQPNWLNKYLTFLLIMLAIIPIIWIAKIQLFSLVMIPFLILYSVRIFILKNKLLTFKK